VAKLIYTALASLDGYIADEHGGFEWAAPDQEVHAFVNEIERPIGTHLYGRRMYEVLKVWETMPTESEPAVIADFAEIWRAAQKIVYSRTLDRVESARTRIERDFDPTAIGRLKAMEKRDLLIGGPTLAADAFAAGLVDEVHLLLSPVTIGRGLPALPTGVRLRLELLDQRRFGTGVVHLHYGVGS
jgi:dihydrofolate reductase